MKKTISIMLLLCAILFMQTGTAFAADAEFYQCDIGFFNQYKGLSSSSAQSAKSYWDKQLESQYGLKICEYNDGKKTTTPNISGRGCNVLRYAHAYQILSGIKIETDEEKVDLLYRLLTCSIKSTTSLTDGERCNTSLCPPESETEYYNFVRNETGAKNDSSLKSIEKNGTLKSHPTPEQIVKFFSEKGGVINLRILNYSKKSGHFILATGYKYDDKNQLWIHIIDSSTGTTVKAYTENGTKSDICIPCDEALAPLPIGAPAKNYVGAYEQNKYNKQGNHYWIKWDDLKSRDGFRVREALYSDVTVAKAASESSSDYTNTHLVSLSSTFTMTKAGNTKTEPYSDAENSGLYVKVGDKVSVTELVTNKYGNIWAKLSDGSYTCFADITKQETYMELVSLTTPFSATNVKKPTGTLTKGSGYGLRGVISGSAPMYSVTARVINRSTGEDALKKVTAYPSMTATKADINDSINDVIINDKVAFGGLPVGYYSYQVTVQPGFKYKDTVYKLGTEQVVITSDFQVGNPPASEDTNTLVKGITLSNIPDDPLLVDEYWYLQATVTPVNATNKMLKWSSSNPSVISVDQEGRIEGKSAGTATITAAATDGSGVKASVEIKCIKVIKAESLTVSDNYIKLTVDEQRKVTATVTPSNVTYGPVWWSNDESIATVSADGVITAVSPGSTEVMVSVESCYVEPDSHIERILVDVVAKETPPIGDVPEPTKKPTGTQIGTTVLKGDVNDDKVVDMLDVILLMEWYCGYDVTINLINADVTGDDTPDMLDIITIMEWYCGYDVDFV